MTFPYKVLLPFMKKCSVAIKLHLNSEQFKKKGERLYHMLKAMYFLTKIWLPNWMILYHTDVDGLHQP